MVQLNEWTGGTMCGATCVNVSTSRKKAGACTLLTWGKCHWIPEWNAVCLFEEMQGQLLYFWSPGKVIYAARTWGGKTPKRKTNSFSSAAVNPGWRRSGSSAEAWPLLLSWVRLTPDTLQSYHGSSDLQSKEIEKEYSLLFVPSPSHLLSLHLRSGLQGTYVL